MFNAVHGDYVRGACQCIRGAGFQKNTGGTWLIFHFQARTGGNSSLENCLGIPFRTYSFLIYEHAQTFNIKFHYFVQGDDGELNIALTNCTLGGVSRIQLKY